MGQYRGLRNETSAFAGIELQPPLLNISSYYTAIGGGSNATGLIPNLNVSIWLNESGPAEDAANTRSWTASGEHFTYDNIYTNGICQPTKVSCYNAGESLQCLEFHLGLPMGLLVHSTHHHDDLALGLDNRSHHHVGFS